MKTSIISCFDNLVPNIINSFNKTKFAIWKSLGAVLALIEILVTYQIKLTYHTWKLKEKGGKVDPRGNSLLIVSPFFVKAKDIVYRSSTGSKNQCLNKRWWLLPKPSIYGSGYYIAKEPAFYETKLSSHFPALLRQSIFNY